jgi:hypothetical protein
MRWADLVLAYIRVLIWPIVVFGLLIIFRSQVRTMISHFADRIKDLKSLRVPGAQIDFEQALLDNKKDLALISHPVEPVAESEAPKPEREELAPMKYRTPLFFDLWRSLSPTLDALAQNSPQTTIVAAWQQVDSTIRLLYRELNPGEPVSAYGTIDQAGIVCRTLASRGVLDNAASVLTVIMRLSNMRISVEGRTITRLEAYEYASSALETSQILLQAADRLRELSTSN